MGDEKDLRSKLRKLPSVNICISNLLIPLSGDTYLLRSSNKRSVVIKIFTTYLGALVT